MQIVIDECHTLVHDVPLGNTPLWVTLVSNIFLVFSELPVRLRSYIVQMYTIKDNYILYRKI